MKIGVLSDTHDNLSNLIAVLETFRENRLTTLIHCGDMTGPELIPYFKDFRLIYVFGNCDITTGTIQKKITRLREDNFAGMVFRGQLDGVPVAVTHSHIENQVMTLICEKRHKWIFHGHTHRQRDEVVHGARIINPGAVGGIGRDPRSFCIIDLNAGNVEFIQLP